MTQRPRAQIDRLLTVEDGTKLMLAAHDVAEDVLVVVADPSDEALWVQIRVNGSLIELPADIVVTLLERARDEVHSEAWFEARNKNDNKER